MEMAKSKTTDRTHSPSVPYEQLGLLRYGDANIRFGVNIEIWRLSEFFEQRTSSPTDDECAKIFGALRDELGVRKFLDDLQIRMHEHYAAAYKVEDSGEQLDAADPEAIMARLSDAEGQDLFALICEAELTEFTTNQRGRLLPLLWDFILTRRDSDSQQELVAVASAIRKYIAMMDVASIGSLSVLLESGHRVSLPLDLELEVAKLVYAKFLANPPSQPDPEPLLACQLAHMAKLYLDPRLLGKVKEGYAVVAMLSLQALAVMLSERWSETAALLCESPRWFRDQLRERLSRAADQWRESQYPRADSLRDLAQSICVS